MKTVLITAALVAAAFPALAGTARGAAPTATIAYADLDLNDPLQAREMLKRIRTTAAAVCRASPGASGRDLPSREAYDRCLVNAVREGVRKLDAPAVRDAYLKGAAPSVVAEVR